MSHTLVGSLATNNSQPVSHILLQLPRLYRRASGGRNGQTRPLRHCRNAHHSYQLLGLSDTSTNHQASGKKKSSAFFFCCPSVRELFLEARIRLYSSARAGLRLVCFTVTGGRRATRITPPQTQFVSRAPVVEWDGRAELIVQVFFPLHLFSVLILSFYHF